MNNLEGITTHLLTAKKGPTKQVAPSGPRPLYSSRIKIRSLKKQGTVDFPCTVASPLIVCGECSLILPTTYLSRSTEVHTIPAQRYSAAHYTYQDWTVIIKLLLKKAHYLILLVSIFWEGTWWVNESLMLLFSLMQSSLCRPRKCVSHHFS